MSKDIIVIISMRCRYPAAFAIVLGLLLIGCSTGTSQAEVAEAVVSPSDTDERDNI